MNRELKATGRKKNIALKLAVVAQETTFYEISKRTGIYPTRLSQIANGVVTPRDNEKAAIAGVLGVTVENIFPKGEEPAR